MTLFQISHFNKPSALSPYATQAVRYTVEAHNIRNAMRRLWDAHRVNLIAGDWIMWTDTSGDIHRVTIN